MNTIGSTTEISNWPANIFYSAISASLSMSDLPVTRQHFPSLCEDLELRGSVGFCQHHLVLLRIFRMAESTYDCFRVVIHLTYGKWHVYVALDGVRTW